MKAAVVYFSGTGNTLKVAHLFKERLIEVCSEVDLIDVTKHNNILKNYDLIIIGSPTYSKVASRKLIEFIDQNIDNEFNKNKEFITFVTHSWEKAYGHTTLKKHLEKRGLKVISSQAFLMPNNFYMMMKEKTSEHEKKNRLEEASNIVDELVKAYKEGYTLNENESNVKRIFYQEIYKMLNRSWIPTFAQKYLRVDQNKCNLCGLCVRKCPNNNIEIKNGIISFKNECLACGRCFNKCPKNAYIINSKK
ncbi:EFR1 family ferrodoxin [Oceanirhabdus sp. W0125-5]|uniref:EFR1 family ferrodoxin n=1 Tax=Oceanirhabdus sp. W0125-5 TaxID=2999116 RepID=UPI0022F33592|nr:EFR1 family ferrodoxin [Oceanirhabdus sp. W0125-5]WBW95175.1 EFR1 family ferrodoxin [Oceanirhabdus sp. W0125-5]